MNSSSERPTKGHFRVAFAPAVQGEGLDWEHSRRFIEAATPLRMGQAWLAEPEPGFRPATVWVWREGDALVVAAEMEDEDIFNPETAFNEPSFLAGDVVEIFLRSPGQEAYYEFHISPENQLFQLRIPSSEVFCASRGKPLSAEWRIADWRVASRVWVDAEHKRWRAMARIPLDRLVEAGGVGEAGVWRVSFSRYDYTRGRERPVHSSTSPHEQLDFHRQQEWRTMHLGSPRP